MNIDNLAAKIDTYLNTADINKENILEAWMKFDQSVQSCSLFNFKRALIIAADTNKNFI